MGIVGLHLWLFKSVPGGTLIKTEESWAGPPVVENVEPMRAALEGSLRRWLDPFGEYFT